MEIHGIRISVLLRVFSVSVVKTFLLTLPETDMKESYLQYIEQNHTYIEFLREKGSL
jgi:hypothetical protein